MSAAVLVVDDEPAIRESVAYALRTEGFEVEEAESGAAALDAASARTYDLILLDVMLGDLSGVEVCRRVRTQSSVPILLLTARDTEVDRVLGLESGADDYVVKPFSMPELVARVRAILRRRDLDRESTIATHVVGDLELDLVRNEVVAAGRRCRVTPSELRLLALLASAPRAFSRREIMQHLWQSGFIGDERTADVHVGNLRRKLENDPARPRRLLTERGVGYRLDRH